MHVPHSPKARRSCFPTTAMMVPFVTEGQSLLEGVGTIGQASGLERRCAPRGGVAGARVNPIVGQLKKKHYARAEIRAKKVSTADSDGEHARCSSAHACKERFSRGKCRDKACRVALSGSFCAHCVGERPERTTNGSCLVPIWFNIQQQFRSASDGLFGTHTERQQPRLQLLVAAIGQNVERTLCPPKLAEKNKLSYHLHK